MRLLKNKKTLISLFLLGVLVLVSLGSVWLLDPHITPHLSLKGQGGQLVGSAPFSPRQVKPFGTDQLGYPLYFVLIKGAKYTIGIALIVSFLRLVVGLLVGASLTLTPRWFQRGCSQLLTPFSYFPVSLLTYILLVSVLFRPAGTEKVFSNSLWQRMVFELVLLTLVGVPTLTIYFRDVTLQFLKEDHISASRVLGARSTRILRKHVWSGIRGRVAVQFVEQIIQVLILLVHLGMFHLFFGGTNTITFPFNQKPPLYQSISSEWSGLIGNGYHSLTLYPWLAIVPLIAFSLLIYFFSLLREGLKEVFSFSNRTNKAVPLLFSQISHLEDSRVNL